MASFCVRVPTFGSQAAKDTAALQWPKKKGATDLIQFYIQYTGEQKVPSGFTDAAEKVHLHGSHGDLTLCSSPEQVELPADPDTITLYHAAPDYVKVASLALSLRLSYEQAKTYWAMGRETRSWVLFVGPPGVGKTHAMHLLGSHLAGPDNKAKFSMTFQGEETHGDLFSRIRVDDGMARKLQEPFERAYEGFAQAAKKQEGKKDDARDSRLLNSFASNNLAGSVLTSMSAIVNPIAKCTDGPVISLCKRAEQLKGANSCVVLMIDELNAPKNLNSIFGELMTQCEHQMTHKTDDGDLCSVPSFQSQTPSASSVIIPGEFRIIAAMNERGKHTHPLSDALARRFKPIKLGARQARKSLERNLEAVHWLLCNADQDVRSKFSSVNWLRKDGLLVQFVKAVNEWLKDKLDKGKKTADAKDHLIPAGIFLKDGPSNRDKPPSDARVSTFWAMVKENEYKDESDLQDAFRLMWNGRIWPHIEDRLRRFNPGATRPGELFTELKGTLDASFKNLVGSWDNCLPFRKKEEMGDTAPAEGSDDSD